MTTSLKLPILRVVDPAGVSISATGILGLVSLTTALLFGSNSLFAQMEGGVKIPLANGSILTAKSAKVEGSSLRIETASGGEMWLEKSDLSPQARHDFFGEPIPETPKPEIAKPAASSPQEEKSSEPPKAEPTPPLEPLLTWKKSDLSSATESFKEEVPQKVEEIPLWVKWYLLRTLGEDVAVYSIRDSGRDAWWCFAEYMELSDKYAGDPKRLRTEWYRRVAQHMAISEHLLKQQPRQTQQRGLAMLVHTATCASLQLKDPLLATAIGEMILANLELAEAKPGFWFSRDGVIDMAIVAFETAKDWERMRRGFLLLAQHGVKPTSQDTAYDGLARLCFNLGRKDEALEWALKIDANGRMASMRQLWLKLLQEKPDDQRSTIPRQLRPSTRRQPPSPSD